MGSGAAAALVSSSMVSLLLLLYKVVFLNTPRLKADSVRVYSQVHEVFFTTIIVQSSTRSLQPGTAAAVQTVLPLMLLNYCTYDYDMYVPACLELYTECVPVGM